MVFSNFRPKEGVLSNDRWKMFGIQTDQLIPVLAEAPCFNQNFAFQKLQSRESYKKHRKLRNYRSDDSDC